MENNTDVRAMSKRLSRVPSDRGTQTMGHLSMILHMPEPVSQLQRSNKMQVGKLIRSALLVGAGALLTGVAFLTRSAGRGQCPQCGYLGDLHACNHCGWTACLSCWQRMGKYNCPGCGQGNP